MRATPAHARESVAPSAPDIFPLPMVGRQGELGALSARLDAVRGGSGSTTLIVGAGGVGKSRLVAALSERAAQRGWAVATGRAYPVETGVPFAVFADALTPMLRAMAPATLAVLTRGDRAMLASIFPALASDAATAPPPDAGGDAKARLLWSFSEFLGRLAAQCPLLVVLENLHWADASSLELLHFVARQATSQRIALLCTYNESALDASPALRATEQSLLSLGVASLIRLEPLDAEALNILVRDTFHADPASARALSGRLFSWTRGNPFFVEELLKALVASGALFFRDGAWHGWEAEPPDLPRSVRDAIAARVDRLDATARTLANLAAVIGTRTTHDVLVAVSGIPERDVLGALDTLRAHAILIESAERGGDVRYEFAHPLVRDLLYAELGIARARLLHAAVAESLESFYGAAAAAHAGELAYHFARAESRGLAGKAVRYLAAAGHSAMARYANREAADYLSAALEQQDRGGDASADSGADVDELVEGLAQVRQRLGDYVGATALWRRAREAAARSGDDRRLAAIDRRLGLASYWSGRHREAIGHLDVALDEATRAGDAALLARIRIAKAMTLQALGDMHAARGEVVAALAIAERLADAALLARVHRASLLLHIFTGPSEQAYAAGLRAIGFAEAAGERGVEWSAHWAMAMVGGLSGNGAAMVRHIAEGERLAEELGSPVLRCWMAEIAIEYASGTGDWDAGLARAEAIIPLARALGQRVLLPRLLVWSALIHLRRGATERAWELLDEAWSLVDHPGENLADVHSAVPVHAGLAAYHVATEEHRRAIEIGERGLALVDRTGYVVWAVHRLLPGIIEAALWLGDLGTATRYRDRLQLHSEQLGHQLGFAWVDTCDAVIALLEKDYERAIPLLRRGADALDAIPWVFDAARVRRNLGWALGLSGDRDGATRELRRAHDVFVQLGAEPDLARTRAVIRELGLRPPAKSQSEGLGGLTGREVDVARLAAAHKSNKEIASALGISPRTVSTHLSNIFLKLEVGSRGELADVARREGLVAH